MTDEASTIPSFGFLLRPILHAVRAAATSISDVQKSVADELNFPYDKIHVAVPAGTKNSFHNDFSVALPWLEKSGLVERGRHPRPGNSNKTYSALSLTPEGKEARATNVLPKMPDDLANRDLATELRKVSQKKQAGGQGRASSSVKRAKRPKILGADGNRRAR